MYKKNQTITEHELNQIRHNETAIIMEKIKQQKGVSIHSFFARNRLKLALGSITILLAVSLFLTTLNDSSYLAKDITNQLLSYREHLETIDLSLSNTEYSPYKQLTNVTKSYTREELEALYLVQTPSFEYGAYAGGLEETRHFLQRTIDYIDDLEEIQFNKDITVDQDEYGFNAIRFTYDDAEHIIIHMTTSSMYHKAIKIGLVNNKLHLKTLDYTDQKSIYFSSNTLYFNYFEFYEDQEMTYISQTENYRSISFTSLIDQISVGMTHGASIVETDPSATNGLHISIYDKNEQYNYSVSFIDDTLVSEQYIFLDDHGMVLYYIDDDTTDDTIDIIWNLLHATGWDQVVVIDSNGYGYKEQGLYLEGTRLSIDASFGVTKNSNQASVLYRQTFSLPLTNDALQLRQLPITWTKTNLTLDYLQTKLVTSKEQAIKDASIFDFDFFDDQTYPLYQQIDQDLRKK